MKKIAAERIEVNPRIMCGKPVIKGTRIPVYLILDLVEAGMSFNEIIGEYPQLKIEDVKAAIGYASHIVKNEEGHAYGA